MILVVIRSVIVQFRPRSPILKYTQTRIVDVDQKRSHYLTYQGESGEEYQALNRLVSLFVNNRVCIPSAVAGERQ